MKIKKLENHSFGWILWICIKVKVIKHKLKESLMNCLKINQPLILLNRLWIININIHMLELINNWKNYWMK